MLALFAAVALDALFSASTLSGAHVGALVTDAQTGRVLYARDADGAFIPASTMKLIVGSAALDDLGSAFSFVTSVATDGSTLYVRGGGDALLAQPDVDSAVATVRALGMTSFPGGIDGDATRYDATPYADGWQVDDLGNDYAAPPSALAYGDNVVHLTLTPSTEGRPPQVNIAPQSGQIRVQNLATTGAPHGEDTSEVHLSWSMPYTLVVSGSIPQDARQPIALDAAMPDPASITLDLFAQAFETGGITLGSNEALAPMPPSARVLWQHHSPPLARILGDMWRPSDNLLAETLLEELGAQSLGSGDTRERGIARERAWLQSIGVDPNRLTIADGSGMSAYDRVTPRALVAILTHDWRGASREVVMQALPVAGRSGTLEHAFTGSNLAGNVIAKTGTSNHTRTLAGYLRTPHGTLIFAFLVNDWMDHGDGAAERLRAVQERFLERIRADASGVP